MVSSEKLSVMMLLCSGCLQGHCYAVAKVFSEILLLCNYVVANMLWVVAMLLLCGCYGI